MPVLRNIDWLLQNFVDEMIESNPRDWLASSFTYITWLFLIIELHFSISSKTWRKMLNEIKRWRHEQAPLLTADRREG